MSDEESSLELGNEGPKGLGLKSSDSDDSTSDSDDESNTAVNKKNDKVHKVKLNKKRMLMDANSKSDDLIKIKHILSKEDITEEHLRQIKDMTNDIGEGLNPVYVRQCMERYGRYGTFTIFIQRNPRIFSNISSKKFSGYSVYSVDTAAGHDNEKETLLITLHAILSADGKKTMKNLLNHEKGGDKKFQIKSGGRVMLEFLSNLMKEMLKSNLEYTKGEIQLMALWKERTIAFYRKNKFKDDYRKGISSGLVPMVRTFDRESLSEDESDLKEKENEAPKKFYRRRCIYKGINRQGNWYFTYDDGSYSYINRNRITGEPWIYDSRSCTSEMKNAQVEQRFSGQSMDTSQ